MAEDKEDSTDDSQKTEEPTSRKLEEARKKGQVVFSREVTNWVLLFTAAVLVMAAGPGIFSDMRQTLQVFLVQSHQIPLDGPALKNLLQSLLLTVGSHLALPLLILIVAAIASGFIQTGPIFSAEPLKPDLSKISVIKGAERLFSSRSIVEFLKGIGKLAIIGIAGFFALWPYFANIEHMVGLDINQSMFDLREMFLRLMIAVLVILFIIAVIDYIYQRHEFMKKMRMSKQEIKEEFKQTEGDPQVKGKLRQLREQKARQRMMQAVPEADVVITNPTHYAVALKYDIKKMDAPVMVAKGVDTLAEKIKEIARENKVTIVENPALARALYDSMDIDDIIPEAQFKAVAEVISYVFKLKGKKL